MLIFRPDPGFLSDAQDYAQKNGNLRASPSQKMAFLVFILNLFIQWAKLSCYYTLGDICMGTVHAIIDLPEELYLSLSASGLTKDRIASESRKLLALKCFKEKILSLGRSAELSGLSKWDFIDYLNENGIPIVDYDEDELAREFKTAETVAKRLKK
jgi:predicted HTH domain antitoxin